MKIVGFAQLRNELSKGNLHNWFSGMGGCDFIYIFDQASDDGSQEVYAQHDNVRVVQSDKNRFDEELSCKRELLGLLLEEHPDTDWILWLDGDTMPEQRLIDDDFACLKMWCEFYKGEGRDGIRVGHLNLWRSKKHYRLDSRYHHLNKAGVLCLWRNNGHLSFPSHNGLHKNQFPDGMGNVVKRVDFSLVHYGFSTDEQIVDRYNTYKSFGQGGNDLDRLIDEQHLDVAEIREDKRPLVVETGGSVDPRELPLINEVMGVSA
tara:strand:- start:36199 stop:36984 length:786 start_codon:yes stop_codon:yes gene_type:complete